MINLPMSTMLDEYVAKFKSYGNTVSWAELLELEERPPVTSIQIHKDDDPSKIQASISWGWSEDEIKLAKIEVDKSFRKKKIGDTLMSMLLAVAKFYRCTKITGVIDGEMFLWDWYRKLGFDVYDKNKLRLHFDNE